MNRPTYSKAQLATLLLLSVVIGCTTCKLVEGSVNLATYTKQDTWKYINKFGYSTGEGEYRVRFRFTAPTDSSVTGFHPVRMYIYLDDNWPKVLAANSCEERIGYASVDLKVNIPNNGDWSETATGNIRQWMRPHVWFFALGDCHGEGAFTDQILNNGNGRLQYELRTLNPDGSEFSVEEQGFGTPYICIMVYLVIFLCTNLNRLRMIYKREEGEIDMAFFTLILAIIVELISIVLEFAHISVYSMDGQGIPSADFASQVASVFSQFIMTCLLVLIAWGWTISFQELKAWYCYVPIGVLVGILQVTMVGLTRIAHDDSSKYHEYDNWAGLLIVLLRVGLFGYFSNGIRDTKTKAAESAKSFANKFGVVGSFYLLAFPALVAITAVAAPYVRHKIITIGTIVAQTVGMAFMAYSFGSKDSEYNSVSIRNTRLILPSGKFDKLE